MVDGTIAAAHSSCHARSRPKSRCCTRQPHSLRESVNYLVCGLWGKRGTVPGVAFVQQCSVPVAADRVCRSEPPMHNKPASASKQTEAMISERLVYVHAVLMDATESFRDSSYLGRRRLAASATQGISVTLKQNIGNINRTSTQATAPPRKGGKVVTCSYRRRWHQSVGVQRTEFKRCDGDLPC